MRSTKAEVFLGETRPGGTLTFTAAEGGPLGVENAGGEPIDIEFAAVIPPPQEVDEGYDPLPQASWIRLEGRTTRTLEPGQSAKTNIVVKVPKDARLRDGQFAFNCMIKGRNAAGSAVTLKTRLSFAVGDGDPPGVHGDFPEGFDASPRAGRLDGVPLGKRIELRGAAFGGLKLINAGDRELKVQLSSLREWPEELRPPEGFVPAPNPRWLKSGPIVRVRPGAIAKAPVYLHIPARDRYAGRSWSFLVALDVDDGKARGRRLFMMSVTTKARSKEHRLKQ
jgi:hypothetical protein